MHPPKRLLLVEATEQPEASLEPMLTRLGHAVHRPPEAWALARPQAPMLSGSDLLLLDADAAGGEGLALLRGLRRHSMLPAIVLSRRNDAFDRVLAFESGADDCVPLPPEPRELQARIASLLRRAMVPLPPSTLVFGDWSLDPFSRMLSRRDGPSVTLSDAECRLMRAFLERPRRVLERGELLRLAGEIGDDAGRRVDLAVSRLRGKMGDDARAPRWIRTLRGRGYLFDPPAID